MLKWGVCISQGFFFMLFHMQVMILVLGAEENRKQLRVGFLGGAGVSF